jgi:hypothetical protein
MVVISKPVFCLEAFTVSSGTRTTDPVSEARKRLLAIKLKEAILKYTDIKNANDKILQQSLQSKSMAIIEPNETTKIALIQQSEKLIAKYIDELGAELSAANTIKVLESEVKREDEKDLKPLKLGSGLQVNTGGDHTNILPTINAFGRISPDHTPFRKNCVFRQLNYEGQIGISIKPDSTSGTVKNVSQTIRSDIGTISADGGFNLEVLRNNHDEKEGPLGFDIRIGTRLAYQRTPSLDNSGTSNNTDSKASDFGVFAPEARIGIWLKYIYAGYKISRNICFGNDNPVSNNLKNSNTHKIILIAKIEALSGGTTESGTTEKQDNPFYLEFSYTGDKNTINNGTFSFGMAKSFNWKM